MRPQLLGCIAPIACACLARAQSTIRVSVATTGAQANGGSGYCALSGDGLHVAFESAATNLASNDLNGEWDVFVRHVAISQTQLVSATTAGVPGNGKSWVPSISSDGLFVAFQSYATDLVAGDTNGVQDIFVRDLQGGATTCASLSGSGAQANGGSNYGSLSRDGRFVAFLSIATNLVSFDTNLSGDIFVRDRLLGTTVLASVDSSNVQSNNNIEGKPSISGDGRHVAFFTSANNLVPNDTNPFSDVFARDLVALSTSLVSVDSAGAQANGESTLPVMSDDGRFTAFMSMSTNLVPGDTNLRTDVFVHDSVTGQTTRVSLAPAGGQANHHSLSWSISPDGRFVGFYSPASNLVAGDTNGFTDAFVHDRLGGSTVRASVSSTGAEADGDCVLTSVSADGRFIAFAGPATNLVPGDTNASWDVFLRDLGPVTSVFCSAGTTTNGCAASISGVGTPSASSGSGFTIAVAAVEGQKQGIVFYGVDNSGFAPLPWGTSSSFLCVKQPTQRTPPQSSGGALNACNGAIALDWNAFVAANPSALGQPFTAGQHVFAQAWFRDPPSPKTTHLSNALEFVVQP